MRTQPARNATHAAHLTLRCRATVYRDKGHRFAKPPSNIVMVAWSWFCKIE